ncbi:aldo/keto reductase [Streptomyces sp. SP18CS02]|uniref:aldo/keto reductase n=1 Tax=Streptomyces sp. SP18CS02 TaxID=3002531 RepID=UPI002E7A960C|nr:aldo/keto reductase [Streptomyces sp. SP18CS02]MEE1753045.1 aldo/keto reductase [Streptomyces sp. SP18CS02]
MTLADLKNWAPLLGIQHEYSLVERTADRELLPMAESLGLGAALWSPLGGGLLTGKYRHSTEGRLSDLGAMIHIEEHRPDDRRRRHRPGHRRGDRHDARPGVYGLGTGASRPVRDLTRPWPSGRATSLSSTTARARTTSNDPQAVRPALGSRRGAPRSPPQAIAGSLSGIQEGDTNRVIAPAAPVD